MTNEPDSPDAADEPTPLPPPEPPPPAQPTSPRRLTRSRIDDWFGGVAGGVAEYFDIDPTLVRIAFVAAALLSSGFGIVAYIVAWIVIPEAGEGDPARPARSRGNTGAILWGGLLIIVGTVVLLTQLDLDINLPSWQVGLSAALIFVGVLMLIEARRGFHSGLVTLAVIVTLLLGVSTWSNFNFGVDGAFGNSQHVVTRAEDLKRDYTHAFGSLTLDLRDLELAPGTTELGVSVVFGNAVLELPEGVPYRIDADSVFGSIEGRGVDARGVANSPTFTSPGYADAERRLDIDLTVVFGSGEVQ